MNFEFLLYLFICFLLSFLIGIERQYRKRMIGLRTTILVSLGAFLFVSFSFSVGANDISRIASQVVTGIGFLGAGVILKDGKKIRGLTTAATLWCDAAIGILCAGGAIFEATLGTIIILFANTILRYINKTINDLSDKKQTKTKYLLTINPNTKNKALKQNINNFISNNKIELITQTIKTNSNKTTLTYEFIINQKNKNQLDELFTTITTNYNTLKITLKKIADIKPFDFDDEL